MPPDGGGTRGERLVVRIGDFRGNHDFPGAWEIRLGKLDCDGGSAIRGELGLALQVGGVAGGAFVIILIAEVMIPVSPIIGAVVSELEIAETLRVGFFGGDAVVIGDAAGGDGLALVVFGR